VREALRDGRLPLWTRYQSAGRPLLAAQQSAPLFPLSWLGVIFPYWQALAWIAVLKVALASLGGFMLARALGLGRAPAMLAGLGFGFSAYLIVWLSHPHANAYVVLPWLLLASERLCRSGGVRDAALLAALLGLAALGGQPESALIVWGAAAAWTAHRLLAARPPRPELLRRAALALAACALGAALAGIMLLPFLEALRQSVLFSRSQPPLPAKVAASLFFPEYWGRPDRAQAVAGPANFTERTLYVGVLPTLLAAAGLVARRPRGAQLFFAGLALVALAVALDTGPLARGVRGLPLLDDANLNRLLILASLAIAMLAAFGLERLLCGSPEERRRMLVAAASLGVLPPLAVLAAHPSWLGGLPDGVARLVRSDRAANANAIALASVLRWTLLAVLTVALLAALARGGRWRRELLGAAAVALAALDLVALGYGYNPAIDRDRADPPAPPAVQALRRVSGAGGRVLGVGGLIPNSAARWGLEDARGHEHPVVKRSSLLWCGLGGGNGDGTVALAPGDPRSPKLLDLLGVRALLLDPHALGRPPRLPWPLRRERVAYAGAGGLVLENRSALPPAFVAYGWRASPGLDASLFALRLGTAREARDEPLIEGATPAPTRHTAPATAARIVSRSDSEVTLSVRARARGQLVLLDTYYPGWRAEVDGRRAPIRPANGAFRAVPVAPGRHIVRFIYGPASVVAGGAISGVAVAVILLCLLLGGSRPPGRGRTTRGPAAEAARRGKATPLSRLEVQEPLDPLHQPVVE
jgi:Bacterial membrane protein YfhO